jgi:hypothetical protein
MSKPKFVIRFDPIGWTGNGQFSIKYNDDAETPFCIVFIGIGVIPEIAKENAKQKAERIVNALNAYDDCVLALIAARGEIPKKCAGHSNPSWIMIDEALKKLTNDNN